MPTYQKVERIPSPDMRMFDDFSKFLKESAKDHTQNIDKTMLTEDKDKTILKANLYQ
jgi:hypothetical protein